MRDREWRVGITGTFDLANYGDLLFPIIAQAELSRRLGRVEVQAFSYSRRTPPHWPYAVHSLLDLPASMGSLDGLIVGGGHLIRFDKAVARGYQAPPPLHHPTGYWLTPALIALQHGVPLAWNAPGVHGDIPAWAQPLVQLAVGTSDYVAVRDEPSRLALRHLVPGTPIALVPDSVFGVARLVDVARPSAELLRLHQTLGITRDYVVVQATSRLAGFAGFARNHPDLFRDCPPVLVPIGSIHGDDTAALGSELPNALSLRTPVNPLLKAELIAYAAAAVGVSLHLSITALAFGVPVLRPADASGGKYEGLDHFETVAYFPVDGPTDTHWYTTRLGRRPPSRTVETAVAELDAHWDSIAAVLARGRSRGIPPLSVTRFWQSLPHELETWAERHASAVAEGQTIVAERDRHIAALAADLAALQRSISWRITAPLRFLRQRLWKVRSTDDRQ